MARAEDRAWDLRREVEALENQMDLEALGEEPEPGLAARLKRATEEKIKWEAIADGKGGK
jgi:hypothetical protein